MSRATLSFRVRVAPGAGVTAIEYPGTAGERLPATLILAHGAGANQHSDFMTRYAGGLAARGLSVVTFNFLYTEQRRRAPDRPTALEACWRAVVEAVSQRISPGTQLFGGGKSMGGRIASQVAAADGADSPLAGLVFLGYPLHPAGRPDTRRDSHLPRIRIPMLFVQGSRDALGSPRDVGPSLRRLGPAAQLFTVDGGDHSFTVPKRWPVAQEDVDAQVQDAVRAWVSGVLQRTGGRKR
ncbi:MAG: hypothetical protein KGN76_05025 [Acidobacteriota bacterium]|nr:hypothetical protein [Acidobacteriota bacterium]